MCNCPNCGKELPEGASFCPHCSTSLNQRKEVRPPRTGLRRLLRVLIPAVLVLALCTGLALHFRPQQVEGQGELLYTDEEGTYQLVLGWPSDRFTGTPVFCNTGDPEGDYRYPVRLYINHVDSGADAGPVFRKKVASCTASITLAEGAAGPMTCTAPEPMDFDPAAAYVSLIDLKGSSGSGTLELKLEMTNGDVILLRQEQVMEPIETWDYWPEDHPMDTTAQLEELLAQINREVRGKGVVNIHLPAVTYTEPLEVTGRSVNLLGSVEGEERTTFAATVEIHSEPGELPSVENINFIGSGTGVGLSCGSTLHVVDCTFAAWKTGVLAYGAAWVNIGYSRFLDNQVGFHFNSEGTSVTHTRYNDNEFRGNDTAILLERVPTDQEISFDSCVFADNGTDIQNPNQQPIDISKASFQ